MIRFGCDYLEGGHPKILEMLLSTNMIQQPGYGKDEYTQQAKDKILKLCNNEDAQVYFLVGGTQANKTIIDAMLRPHQGVLSPDTGHINGHEAGAIEATGHKVLTLPSVDGKITAQQVEEYYNNHWDDSAHDHLVQPGMVYISFPTENGTIYTKEELTNLSNVCKKCGMYFFMDGARLGYGLSAKDNDVTLQDIANLFDVFYIGGTKVGALLGEAVVISNKNIQKDFTYIIKQNGSLLSKGRLLGIQFLTLFDDGLYFEITKKANKQAMLLKKTFLDKGITMMYDTTTNQIFPVLSQVQVDILSQTFEFSIWEKQNDSIVTRFCTSWATTDENVNILINNINQL